MVRKIVVSPKNSKRVLAFFADLARLKSEARKRAIISTAHIRELLSKDRGS